ncbi:MAG: hypothetical protein M1821_007632 [Bathelium mastoideum]|nr:MAG: hypothetical protein M1821_007632 [Bathelium mastoideum]
MDRLQERIAIALYRALLKQTSVVALQPEERQAVQNVIRNKFKGGYLLTSERLLKNAFTAGYQALDRLDAAAVGTEGALGYLRELLSKTPSKLQQPVQNRRSRNTKKGAPERPLHTGRSVLDRPLPKEKLAGKRVVPRLIGANGVPFLRFKKPQPRNLSLLISHRIKQREDRYERQEEARDMLEIAKGEDQWDRILWNKFKVGSAPKRKFIPWGSQWDHPWRRQIWVLRRLRDEEKVKNAILAAKMHDIVVQEQKLADEEEKERALQEAGHSAASGKPATRANKSESSPLEG